MEPFKIGEHVYQAGKLQVRPQLMVAKRITPVVMCNSYTPEVIGAVFSARMSGEKLELSKFDLRRLLPAIGDAIKNLSDDDAWYVITETMAVVQRQGAQSVWVPVMNSNGDLQFDDITVPQMLQISWKVIEDNLGGFFSIAR